MPQPPCIRAWQVLESQTQSDHVTPTSGARAEGPSGGSRADVGAVSSSVEP